MQETGEQIRLILEMLPTSYISTYADSLNLWLTGHYLDAAANSWKALTRYEQADQYIRWLIQEREENGI